MKRFDFRLNPLLNYREYGEKLAKQEVAAAYRDVKACEETIARLKSAYIQTFDEMSTCAAEGINAERFRSYYTYLDAVDSAIVEETQKREMLNRILNEKIDALKQKSVDRKVIEQLKERKETEYMAEVRKIDQKDIDEISALKKARELNHDAGL